MNSAGAWDGGQGIYENAIKKPLTLNATLKS